MCTLQLASQALLFKTFGCDLHKYELPIGQEGKRVHTQPGQDLDGQRYGQCERLRGMESQCPGIAGRLSRVSCHPAHILQLNGLPFFRTFYGVHKPTAYK